MIAVGPGTLNDKGELRPLDVKAGDRILFGKWSGTEVKQRVGRSSPIATMTAASRAARWSGLRCSAFSPTSSAGRSTWWWSTRSTG